MAGRLPIVLPFLPFTSAQQLVMSSESFLKVKRKLWNKPIDGANPRTRLATQLRDELDALRRLSRRHYDPQTGARSLEQQIGSDIQTSVIKAWLSDPNAPMNEDEESGNERYEISVDNLDFVTVSRLPDLTRTPN